MTSASLAVKKECGRLGEGLFQISFEKYRIPSLNTIYLRGDRRVFRPVQFSFVGGFDNARVFHEYLGHCRVVRR